MWVLDRNVPSLYDALALGHGAARHSIRDALRAALAGHIYPGHGFDSSMSQDRTSPERHGANRTRGECLAVWLIRIHNTPATRCFHLGDLTF